MMLFHIGGAWAYFVVLEKVVIWTKDVTNRVKYLESKVR